MDAQLILVPLAALAASLITFISGFGLGTLLLPVFALFFPLPWAILLTAVVHFLNNLFKIGLLYKQVDRGTVLRFGLPAIAGAYLGAALMHALGERAPLFQGVRTAVDPLDLTIASLMALFGVLEMSRSFNQLSLPARWMMPGGAISGFFGGLSGHQGALRSIFLLRVGLNKEAYIATGVAIACLVDLTRLPMYLASGRVQELLDQWPVLTLSTLAAFVGAWWGRKLIPKITFRGVQITVGALLITIALLLGAGII